MAETGLSIAINCVCSAYGGGRTHLRQILPLMFDLGSRHRFTVYVSEEDESEFVFRDAPNVRWEIVPISGLATTNRLLWENFVLPFRLLADRQDVVLAPANLTHFLGGVRRVIIIHNVLPFHPEIFGVEPLRSRLRLRFLAWASRHFIRRAAGTIFLSQAGRADALAGAGVTPRDEDVIYHGVDPNFGTSDPIDARREVAHRLGIDRPYVLYASHLYRYKKTETLIDAISRLDVARVGEPLLVLAGAPYDDAYTETLRQQAWKLGLERRVTFLGSVGYDDLSVLHAGASALVFLSICENCPNLVLEALASGRPLVVSNRSVMPELCQDAALEVDPESPDEVASALERVLTDESLASELGRRGRERARDFSWRETAARTLAILERVAEHRPGNDAAC